MKNISFVLALFVAAFAPVRAQSVLSGTWQATSPGAIWTVTLKVNGSAVSGSVSSCSSPRASGIYDGNLAGNVLTFKCTSADGDRTVAFRGTINGDDIVFTREGQVRSGGIPFFRSDKVFGPDAPQQFSARRVYDAARTEALNETDHVRTAGLQTGAVYYEEGAAIRPLSKSLVDASAGAAATAEIEGSAASTRFSAGRQPVFRVCGVDPSQYKLYTLRSERDSRALETSRPGIRGGSTPVLQDREVATTITSAGGNCFAVIPRRALDRGEYGIHRVDSNDVFDFGVDEAGR